jgi:hypothetical protein
MLEECNLRAWLVVEWYHLIEDREVACLLDIGHSTEDEPAWVIVESATDIVVASFGERLILVVASSVGELCRGDIDNTLTCTGRNLVYETYEVLVGVTESHASSYTALEE